MEYIQAVINFLKAAFDFVVSVIVGIGTFIANVWDFFAWIITHFFDGTLFFHIIAKLVEWAAALFHISEIPTASFAQYASTIAWFLPLSDIYYVVGYLGNFAILMATVGIALRWAKLAG